MYGALLCVLTASVTAPAVIHVDASGPSDVPVPRAFFGQFGEHISCNVYNGQWAQVLRNGGFEGYEYFEHDVHLAKRWLGFPDITAGREQGLACYWLPEGDAVYAMDDEDPFNSALSQRVSVNTAGGLRVPVKLPLHRERGYEFSFHARAQQAMAGRILLRTEQGETLCEAPIRIDGAAWSRYAARLTVPEGPEAGGLLYLVVLFENPGTCWLDHAELFPADHIDGLDPDVAGLLKAARPALLRFPGGNFVSGYHWRDGIGPRTGRVMMPNPAWNTWESNHFGTHEWMAFAKATGAEPFICVNCGNGTPEEAADWVRYCNEPPGGPLGRLRAANGHEDPFDVRYWEVGNELWGDWQIGHCGPEEYARRYDAFARAMREADPGILLIANGGDGNWNEVFLENVNEPVRSLSCHRLIGWGVPADAAAADAAMWLAAYSLEFEKQLDDMREVCRASGRPDVKLAITELMSVVSRPGGPLSHSRHTENLFFAGMMNACIRHRDFVELITRTAVINHGGGRAKIAEVAFPEPVHFLSVLYGTMSGRWPVQCQVDAPVYDAELGGLAPIRDVPVLDVTALLDDGRETLTLLVTNRDARSVHEAAIRLTGFDAKAGVRVRTIAGEPDAFNVWNQAPAVSLVPSRFKWNPGGTYCFPRASVTELVFRR